MKKIHILIEKPDIPALEEMLNEWLNDPIVPLIPFKIEVDPPDVEKT